MAGLSEADVSRLDSQGWDVVSPGYFHALGLPVVQGRAFTADDRDGRPLVAIVNETFARIAWPGQPAIGQRFYQTSGKDDPGRALEVVGVARDAKYRNLGEEPRTLIYVPFAQHPQTRVEVFLRHLPGRSLERDVRAAISSVEPALPVVLMQGLDDAAAVSLLPQRVGAWIAGVVGAVGMFLAALGLYGLAAFVVAQRTREIAIRMALGASRGDVRGMVLAQTARLSAIGTGSGLLLAWGLGRVIRSLNLLVGVQPGDPLTLSLVTVMMSAILFIASYVPARRAAGIDPTVGLRAQ